MNDIIQRLTELLEARKEAVTVAFTLVQSISDRFLP